MTAARETDIEDAVRRVLGDVLSEVSEELSAPADEPPAPGRSSRGTTSRMTARSGTAPRPSPTPTPMPPDETPDVPPGVSDAVEAVLRDLTPEQAQTLAALFDAIGDRDEEDEESELAAGFDALELGTMSEAKAQGKIIAQGGVDKVIQLLWKNRRLLLAAGKAAMRGQRAFRAWANGLSKFNPIRWAISLMPSYLLGVLIDRVIEAYHKLTGGRIAPNMRAADNEPAEIEHVVRRVLSNALAEPQDGARAH